MGDGWRKFAILGSTYARALQNAAQRAGQAAPAGAYAGIAAQPLAKLKPGLSTNARAPGALPQTPQISAMQDLTHRMPWAGDEHTTDAMSSKAEGRFNRLLDRRGLSQNTPAGQPNTHQMISQEFGSPAAFRKSVYTADQTQTGRAPLPPQTSAGRPQAIRARTPSPAPVTDVLPAAPAAMPRQFPRAKFGSALSTAAGIGIPLAVGGGLLASRPGINANLKNLVSGKGSTKQQDTTNEIPEAAMNQAAAIHQALTAHGLDPSSLRLGIDAPPGSGKTTLARALAQQTGMKHWGLDWEPHNALKSTIGLGRSIEKMPHPPRAGEITEHYMLNRAYDPELFDAQIHLKRDPETLKQQLRQRGNAAYIGDMMSLDKSLGVSDLGYDTLNGENIDLGNGTFMKLRPKEGWGDQLDQQLAAKGIDARGLSRHSKLLSLYGGKRTEGAGWTPYLQNPLSHGQTLALGASVPLGVLAAKALARRAV